MPELIRRLHAGAHRKVEAVHTTRNQILAAGAVFGLTFANRRFFCKRGVHLVRFVGNRRGFYLACPLCSFTIESTPAGEIPGEEDRAA